MASRSRGKPFWREERAPHPRERLFSSSKAFLLARKDFLGAGKGLLTKGKGFLGSQNDFLGTGKALLSQGKASASEESLPGSRKRLRSHWERLPLRKESLLAAGKAFMAWNCHLWVTVHTIGATPSQPRRGVRK
jgi:hypothetical protein